MSKYQIRYGKSIIPKVCGYHWYSVHELLFTWFYWRRVLVMLETWHEMYTNVSWMSLLRKAIRALMKQKTISRNFNRRVDTHRMCGVSLQCIGSRNFKIYWWLASRVYCLHYAMLHLLAQWGLGIWMKLSILEVGCQYWESETEWISMIQYFTSIFLNCHKELYNQITLIFALHSDVLLSIMVSQRMSFIIISAMIISINFETGFPYFACWIQNFRPTYDQLIFICELIW